MKDHCYWGLGREIDGFYDLSYLVGAEEYGHSGAVPDKEARSSFSKVVPAGLVIMSDSDTPLRVSWVLSAAEAAKGRIRLELPRPPLRHLPRASFAPV